jgi:hypothetical protein
MKKTILILSGVFLLTTTVVLEGCKKPDEEKPTLTLSEPENGEIFDSGTKIHVEGIAKDNRELSQLKIDIHDAFDGHTHGKITSGATAFSIVKVINLEGKEVAFHEDIQIPLNTLAGKYHVTVSVVDEAGNLSNIEERDIIIRNSTDLIAPMIEVISPTDGQIVSLNGTLNVQALISDNEELEDVIVKIKNSAGVKVYEWKNEHIESQSYELDHVANLVGLPAGNYEVEIIAIDHVNNVTDVEIDIVIQ